MFVANNSLVKTKFFFPKHSTSVPVLCCGSFPSLIQEDKLLLFWEIIIVDGKELWKMLYEILMGDQDEGRSESDGSEISDLG